MTGRIVLLGSVTGYIESFHQQSQSQYGDTAHYSGTVSVSSHVRTQAGSLSHNPSLCLLCQKCLYAMQETLERYNIRKSGRKVR